MNTTHIKSFLYVSQYNSISKAADRLNYSTSTIYEHLKALEHEVGVTAPTVASTLQKTVRYFWSMLPKFLI